MDYRIRRKVVFSAFACIGLLQSLSIAGAQLLSSGSTTHGMVEKSISILQSSFEQSARIPSSGKAAILFRHSGTGFLESAGFDTELISISTAGTPLIQEVTILQERAGIPTVKESYAFESKNGMVVCKNVLAGSRPVHALIEPFDDGLVVLVRNPESRTEYRDTRKEVVIKTESRIQLYGFRNLPEPSMGGTPISGSGGSGIGEIKSGSSNSIISRNLFEKNADGSWASSESAFDDPEMSMALETHLKSTGTVIEITIQNLAPVADVAVSGIAELLTGPGGLENMARLDAVLGPDRNMRAALAWFLLTGQGGN